MTNAQQEDQRKFDGLTRTEKKILGMIAENKTSPEIAKELFVSVRTVQNHRYNISGKLGLKGPNSLLEYAIRNKPLISGMGATKTGGEITLAPGNKSKSKYFIFGSSLLIGLILAVVIINRGWIKHDLSPGNGMESEQIRIAVLPMRTTGPDSIAGWISEGLTEELIIQLSGIPGLRVIAYGSVRQYNPNEQQLDKIANELNVGILIDGSMRKTDSLFRINLQVIDVRSGENIWAAGYDVAPPQYSVSQNEVAMRIARALEVEFFLEKLSGESSPGSDVAEAQESLLKGRFYVNRGTRHGFMRAENLFREAIAIDSSFARAWAELANVYTWKSNYGIMDADSAYSLARKAAEKAIALNPDIGEAHRARGAVALLYDWDFKLAESELTKAMSMNPSDVMVYRLIALLHLATGKHGEAISYSKMALELDPQSVMNNAIYGRTLYFSRTYEQSIQQLRETLQMEPGFWLATTYLAESLLEQDNHSAAVKYLESAVAQQPGNKVALSRLGHGYARAGQKEKAQAVIRSLMGEQQYENTFHFQVALIHTALGNHDSAFHYLDKAYEERHDYMLDLRSDPKLDDLRNDQRFLELLDKMGF